MLNEIQIDNDIWPPENVMCDYKHFRVESRYDDICDSCGGDGYDDNRCDDCTTVYTIYAANKETAAHVIETIQDAIQNPIGMMYESSVVPCVPVEEDQGDFVNKAQGSRFYVTQV